MKIKLLAIGKTDDKNLQVLIQNYEKRLKHYIKFELEIIPDLKNVKNLSETEQKEKEGTLILKRVNPSDQLILLDENGPMHTSKEFSKFMQKKMNSGIKQVVMVIGGPYGFSNAVYQKAKNLMKMTGIDNLADRTIIQGSGGQLQRVAICRSLINNPDIIFGDEPTGALDSKSTREIMSILAEINKEGTTVMLVTHDVKVAAKTERILFMVDGNLVAQKKMLKYDEQQDDIKQREESIMKWLVENGF